MDGEENEALLNDAVGMQMNYDQQQGPSSMYSSFAKNVRCLCCESIPLFFAGLGEAIFLLLCGKLSPTDSLIKQQGSTFKHIKSTNLFQYMDDLCNWIFERNPRYKGSLEAIGSEAEGIRVNASDYDFLLVSDTPNIQFEKLEIKLAEMPSVRADVNSGTNLRKSYFKVFFKDDVPEEWNDCTDTGSKCLNARLVQQAFAEAMTDTIKPQAGSNWNDQPAPFTISNEGNNIVTLNGPAVTIVVNDRTNGESKRLNTDITFAIPVNLTDSTDFWPLEGLFPGVELTDHVKAGQPIKAVHLVPAGDFWRLSFVLEERERMKRLLIDKNKHTCVVALKAMRNSVSLTHDDESPLLSSYPLKWSFMMETQDPEPETWEETTLGEHTLSILDRVVQCGSTGSMSSFFLKEDPVLKDSDRSYLESRRIKKLIEEDVHNYSFGLALHLFVTWISATPLGLFVMFNGFNFHSVFSEENSLGNGKNYSNNSSECAQADTCSALLQLLPIFIFYGIALVVFAIRLLVKSEKFGKIIIGILTLVNLLHPTAFIAKHCSSRDKAGNYFSMIYMIYMINFVPYSVWLSLLIILYIYRAREHLIANKRKFIS